METATLQALESVIWSWPIGVAFVLVLSALVRMTKTLLSTSDREKAEDKETIAILRKNIESDREKLFWFITSLSVTLEKLSSLLEKHDVEAIRHRDKVLSELDMFKRDFNSLPCKFKWQS